MDAQLKEFFGDAYPPEPADYKQVGGSHYLRAIQPWDIIRAWNLNFWEGNCLKYLLRHQYKNRKEDLEKAIHYLEYLRDNYESIYDAQ